MPEGVTSGMTVLPALIGLQAPPLALASTREAARTLTPAGRFAPAVRRLVVLIPEADTNKAELARLIWTLAARGDLAVLLLGLGRSPQREPRAHRRLATLAALIRDKRVSVETRLHRGGGWLEALRAVHRTSDFVLCQAEQQIMFWGLRRQPLSQWLLGQMDSPIGELAGFYPHLPPNFINPAARLAAALIPFVVFFGFTALQLLIHRRAEGSAYAILLALSVVLEYGLLGLWNYFFN